jgi:hypothetical protein
LLNTILGSFSTGAPPVAPTSYESIATVTVGSGGAANVEFTSIPATYTHLQIRYMTLFSVADWSGKIQFNSDTGSNYAWHRLLANGSSVSADAASSQVNGLLTIGAPSSTNAPGCGVTDILDYANTNKYKTVRDLAGTDANGNGYIHFVSALWQNTNAITSIKITPGGGVYNQYSSFALYGIKG